MDLAGYLSRGATINSLLREAGFRDDAIQENRAFRSRWAWDDGRTAVVTIWVNEVLDPRRTPKWSESDPAQRTDLSGTRRKHAEEVYSTLLARDGQPVRVMLQRLKPDPAKRAGGAADARGLDPESWYVSVGDGAVYLQRGAPEGRRTVDVSGAPLPSRPPGTALRETRPEQPGFRARVAMKTGNRCALTGAPPEVCDAAYFIWANWRTDNEARHGILLRRDLHAALDAGLLTITESGMVAVSEYLARTSPDYAQIHGRSVPI
jgi:hypothetical protein